MKKLTFCVAILAGALVMMAQSARAQEGFRLFRGDPELIIPSIGVGLATTGAYFAVRNAGGGGIGSLSSVPGVLRPSAAWRSRRS
jgi:hypothetical protein